MKRTYKVARENIAEVLEATGYDFGNVAEMFFTATPRKIQGYKDVYFKNGYTACLLEATIAWQNRGKKFKIIIHY